METPLGPVLSNFILEIYNYLSYDLLSDLSQAWKSANLKSHLPVAIPTNTSTSSATPTTKFPEQVHHQITPAEQMMINYAHACLSLLAYLMNTSVGSSANCAERALSSPESVAELLFLVEKGPPLLMRVAARIARRILSKVWFSLLGCVCLVWLVVVFFLLSFTHS